MKKLIPNFTIKDFWIDLLVGALTVLTLWWLGIIQFAYSFGKQTAEWFFSLF